MHPHNFDADKIQDPIPLKYKGIQLRTDEHTRH